MKLTASFFAAVILGAAALHAAPLAETTPVYAQPDATAAVISSLKPGTEAAVTNDVPAPAGWIAVILAGPHEVYAANKDVTKSLDVRVGSSYLTEAKADAPVLAIAQKDDQTEIIDYRGKWTKFRLTKPVVGYIKGSIKPAVTVASPSATTSTVTDTPAAAAPTVTAVGRAAPVGDGASAALPRLFQGKFASTYSPLRPRRPYDFQLTDDAGARYAYIDVSKLLATEQLTKYTDRTVVIYGTARAVPGSKDMVVVAESLQLR